VYGGNAAGLMMYFHYGISEASEGERDLKEDGVKIVQTAREAREQR
jgi:hypothetical protein